ncbi:hypothetical protein QBC47DRAFT_408474 [Echria macrotheca]|uniref:Increased recombination centers protein 6 n=1 Tax=Echria macrotheca TaxID=438768 RepID=A0AAJ0BLC1_9PEZI|nr:hypothetical protein QBC47DRAFT_408474 [Echria macrotheca]
MEISNPRRILAVSLDDSTEHLSHVIKGLTGSHPTPQSRPQEYADEIPTPTTPGGGGEEKETLAGTTHTLRLATRYYAASIPVWLDVVSSPVEWAASFLAEEAREVLEALGGLVVVFEIDGVRSGELVGEVGRVVRDGLGGWEWDGVGIALGIGGGGGAAEEGELDEWEDLCAGFGMEFVHLVEEGKGAMDGGRNEFGERVGVARVLEALEANDWDSGGGGGGGGDGMGGDEEEEDGEGDEEGGDEDEFDPEKMGFGFDREDFAGLKKAIWDAGRDGTGEGEEGQGVGGAEPSEEEVQKVERMMRRLMAVRETIDGLPEEQRKRVAKRAVGEVMKEL